MVGGRCHRFGRHRGSDAHWEAESRQASPDGSRTQIFREPPCLEDRRHGKIPRRTRCAYPGLEPSQSIVGIARSENSPARQRLQHGMRAPVPVCEAAEPGGPARFGALAAAQYWLGSDPTSRALFCEGRPNFVSLKVTSICHPLRAQRLIPLRDAGFVGQRSRDSARVRSAADDRFMPRSRPVPSSHLCVDIRLRHSGMTAPRASLIRSTTALSVRRLLVQNLTPVGHGQLAASPLSAVLLVDEMQPEFPSPSREGDDCPAPSRRSSYRLSTAPATPESIHVARKLSRQNPLLTRTRYHDPWPVSWRQLEQRSG
jgi:hypothetical protein